ncbi:MAG: hypothetical protein NC079_04425 [Clostridium sp.]|nr:hypothetical protein [Acetatifactor muris]MCM1526701.1 hypothetical protein [Bacteroides sp.]MCM1562838.1 hypothetical protein [Clostridium sp.]
MNSFKIDHTEFGIGEISLSIENGVLDLEITGNDSVFNELMKDDNCEWIWALYPPRIYFHGIPYKENEIVVDTDFLDRYEIALYMMEHNDFIGSLKVTESTIDIHGKVYIDGGASTLDISVERKGI